MLCIIPGGELDSNNKAVAIAAWTMIPKITKKVDFLFAIQIRVV
jgi:hypothetical protein